MSLIEYFKEFALLGAECRTHDVLYSSRILKKTGLRIGT